MKKILFLTFIITTLSTGNCFAQKESSTDKEQIENLIRESFDAVFSNRDKNTIHKFFSEDFLLLEDGQIWNKDSISGNLDRMNAKIAADKITVNRINKINFISSKIEGKMAWVAYHNTAVYNDGKGKIYGEDHWLESVVAVRTKSGWKIQMLHSTLKK